MNIRCAILGPTGYTSLYLIKLLVHHPAASVTYLASHRDELPNIADEFPQLSTLCDLTCRPINPAAIAAEADVAFLCLPHKAAMAQTPALLAAGLKVIDLSADYRLADPALYQAVYHTPHTDTANLSHAVYGLPELFSDAIPSASLVANPGCYPTAAALAIAPLIQHALIQPGDITINAASGVTGAGRAPKPNLHFPEVHDGFNPYAAGEHRHQPEIEQSLSRIAGHPVRALFVPHLLPVDRGILETIYLTPIDDDVTADDLAEAFEDAYADCPFIRIRSAFPNIAHVRDTNFCDIAYRLFDPAEHPSPAARTTPDETSAGDDGDAAADPDAPPRRIILFAAIDNMIKGASGQAVQNMNMMFGLPQTTGLL